MARHRMEKAAITQMSRDLMGIDISKSRYWNDNDFAFTVGGD